MRRLAVTLAFVLAATPALIAAQEAQAPKPAYSSSTTPLGTLMADPQAKAVLIKHVPMMAQNRDQQSAGGGLEEQAAGMTLRELAEVTKAYTGEMFSDKVMAEIDADLAKLPAAK